MLNKLVIGREAFDKIMYYVDKAKFEISGFGNVQVIDGIPTVTDIILLKQENTSVETDIDAEAICKAEYEHMESGMEGDLKFWWHSHVNMSVYWSGTDKATITQLTKNGWYTHGVFNKRGEFRLAYSNNEPVEVFLDDLDLEIDENMVNDDDLLGIALNEDDILTDIDKLKEMITLKEKEFNELDAGKKTILSNLCDPKFDELVTDKCYSFPQTGFGNDWRKELGIYSGDMGKHAPSMMATTQLSSATLSSGTDCMHGNYYDAEGASELFMSGYTEEEIIYMQNYCYVYDYEDLIHYESTYNTTMNQVLASDKVYVNSQTKVDIK